MILLRKLMTFARMPWGRKLLIAQAVVFLGLARLCVIGVPFRFIAKWLAKAPNAPIRDSATVNQVGWAVRTAANAVPWNAVCLPQAMAAKAMLAMRGQGSACHFGATFDAEGGISAHAWLECDGRIVTGASGMKGMSHLTQFG